MAPVDPWKIVTKYLLHPFSVVEALLHYEPQLRGGDGLSPGSCQEEAVYHLHLFLICQVFLKQKLQTPMYINTI